MMKLSVFIVFVYFVCGLCKENKITKNLHRCRQMCYTKFVKDWQHCMDYQECKDMCITPSNINNYIPEAFSFLCSNSCDETLDPFILNVTSAVRQGSLILTNIAWDQAITNSSKQCLVTWEVAGGGLMGNLLTDSSSVELSLWMDTVYHVQVTCKNKLTLIMRRSIQLTIDTQKLIKEPSTTSQPSLSTGLLHENNPISKTSISTLSSSSLSSTIPSSTTSSLLLSRISTMSTSLSDANRIKQIQDIFLSKSYSKDTTQKEHLQILKDNSKDNKKIINRIELTTKPATAISSSSSSEVLKESSLSHIPTVIRSKLISSPSSSSSLSSSSSTLSEMNKYNNSKNSKNINNINSNKIISDTYLSTNIIYAIIESLIVFLGILFIYILIRSSRSYHDSESIDKEELIRNEYFSGRRIVHM